MLKAIELLNDYKKIDFGCNVDELHNEIDIAIKELQKLEEDETIVCEKCGSSDTVIYCFGEDDKFQCLSCSNLYRLEEIK